MNIAPLKVDCYFVTCYQYASLRARSAAFLRLQQLLYCNENYAVVSFLQHPVQHGGIVVGLLLPLNLYVSDLYIGVHKKHARFVAEATDNRNIRELWRGLGEVVLVAARLAEPTGDGFVR